MIKVIQCKDGLQPAIVCDQCNEPIETAGVAVFPARTTGKVSFVHNEHLTEDIGNIPGAQGSGLAYMPISELFASLAINGDFKVALAELLNL